jgi:basic amino acid/polyamine antiporter, APA family
MNNEKSQKIGLITATIVGMNAMIGAGIFSVPAALGSYVGPAGIITYLFVIIAVWFMGSSMARLAQLYPEEGSFYTYAKQWGGHAMGLLSAGAYLIGLVIAMGLLTQMAGQNLHESFPYLSSYAWGLITLVGLIILNLVGVTLSQIGQIVLICCTVLPIILTIIIGFTHGNVSNLTPFLPYGFKNIFSATNAVIFGFFGFECASSLFSVVENPQKNVPKALRLSIFLVGLLYLAFVGSIIYAVPLHYFSDPSISLRSILGLIVPNNPWLLHLIHFSVLSAILGTVHSMIWGSSTLLVSYAKKLNAHFLNKIITPRTSVLLIGICIFITFTVLKNINVFFNLTSIFLIFAFVTSMITLLTLPEEWKSGNNIKTILGLLTAFLIFYFALSGLLLS